VLNYINQHQFLPARRSMWCPCYSATCLGGWLAVRHSRYCIKTTKPITFFDRLVAPSFKHLGRYQIPGELLLEREAAVNTGASQPSSAASAGDPTPASSLWAKLNAAKSSNAVSASSATNDAASRQIMHQQLATYLAEPTLPHSENPLSWWAMNCHNYPSIAAVARRLLAVPATSVASERLFSKAGNESRKKRNCLASAKADSVVFCMENL